MTNRVPLMAGNWKMNLDHLEANHLVQGLAMALQDDNHDYTACEVLVLPPFTDIRTVQTIVDADDLDIKYGAQDVSVHDNGAYTGEVSASMLTKLGALTSSWATPSAASTTASPMPLWAPRPARRWTRE